MLKFSSETFSRKFPMGFVVKLSLGIFSQMFLIRRGQAWAHVGSRAAPVLPSTMQFGHETFHYC
jgi:hypothetical protein